MTQFNNTAIVAGNLVADAKVVDTTSTLKDGTPFKILECTLALNNGGENTPPSFVTVQLVGYVAKRVLDAGKHLKGLLWGLLACLLMRSSTQRMGELFLALNCVGKTLCLVTSSYQTLTA